MSTPEHDQPTGGAVTRYTVPRSRLYLVAPVTLTLPWDEAVLGKYGTAACDDRALDGYIAERLALPAGWVSRGVAVPGRTSRGVTVVCVVAGRSDSWSRVPRGTIAAVPCDASELTAGAARPTASRSTTPAVAS